MIETAEYDEELELLRINEALAQIFGFASARDEVDFAFSLGPEFRGMQDAGWNTAEETIVAFHEGVEILNSKNHDRAALRNVLYRYLCLSEASGLYEVLGNQLSILGSEVYNLWPFGNIVVRHSPTGKIAAPNANRVFRELSKRAENLGLVGVSETLANVFNDDLRNAVAHADFVIWEDGLRLRKRNGGNPTRLDWARTNQEIKRGFVFFELLLQSIDNAMLKYLDGRIVVGKGSGNPVPFEWTIKYDPNQGLSISTTSPGAKTTPEFKRSELLKSLLGSRVLVVISYADYAGLSRVEAYYRERGIEAVLKLHSSRAEYIDFVTSIAEQSDLLFLDGPPDAKSEAIVVTPLGVVEANEANLGFVLPEIPEFAGLAAEDPEASGPKE